MLSVEHWSSKRKDVTAQPSLHFTLISKRCRVLYPGMFRGLSQRSKQSSKELEEIARMTEPCLFSDRLIHCQWVLLVQLFSDLCKYPHTVSHTQSVGAAFREIPFCIPTTITWCTLLQGETARKCISSSSVISSGGVPFQWKFFQFKMPFPTLTRTQYIS